jgi:hypothetical protein
LTEPFRRSTFLARLLSSWPRPYDWAVDRLDRAPPASVLRPNVVAIALWEHFVHHEDVRRPNQRPRDGWPDLSVCVPWLLRFNENRLRGLSLRIESEQGEWRAGAGEEVVLAGPLAEAVMWLSGRPAAADLRVRAEPASVDAVHRRLAI